ncbi:MAG: hypothetical protein DYH08_02930 [Actinobacteria bacterium ATB1]|nr:hypothetical protein [Actinobacteria bacterium ATB1]
MEACVMGSEIGSGDAGLGAELGEIEARLAAAIRMEQRAYADDLIEERERATTFRDRLLALRLGRAVRLRTVDGFELRGRITAVGQDWFTFAESDSQVPPFGVTEHGGDRAPSPGKARFSPSGSCSPAPSPRP